MGKGNQTTTSTNSSTTSADPQAAAAYRALLDRASGVASTPYQSYSGELTAPVNAQQNTGIGNINANAGFASPFIQQATGMAANAGQPLSASDIQRYASPYTQSVVDATQASFANQNGQQQAALTGNNIAQGALGGNRVGVAQANLAGQQQAAQAPVIAGLYNTGYQQAVQTAQGQQQAGLNAAYALGNLGVSGQQAALSGAGAQVGAGTLQQQSQQAQDTALYNQFLQQQAYPFQTTQWLAGLQTGVGSQLGGTSSGQGSQTQPSPSPWSQIAGLGLAAASLFRDGGAVAGFDNGGAVRGYDSGGQVTTPYGGAPSWVPVLQVHGGAGAPRGSAPSAPGLANQSSGTDVAKMAKGFAGLGNIFSNPSYGGGSWFAGDSWGGSGSNPLPGLDASDYGDGFRSGGPVAGFADGGAPAFDDRFDAAFPNMVQPAAVAPVDIADPVAGFGERFGNLPPAQKNLGFQDAYFAANGVAPDAFAGSNEPQPDVVPSVPSPGVAPSGPAPVDDARTAVAGFAPAVDDEGADDGTALGFAAKSGPGAPTAGVGSAPPTPEQAERNFSILQAMGMPPLSAAARSGLLTAGLAMMASRSPNFLQAVGEGGLAGVGAYSGTISGEQKSALDQRRVDLEAQRLTYDADKAAKDLALRTASQQETARHNKAGEDKEFKPKWGQIGADPVTGIARYGWTNPNNMSVADAAGKPIDATAPQTSAADTRNLEGPDYIKELERTHPEFARTVKAIGDYRSSITSMSNRGGQRERLLEAAIRYNPDYDQTQFTAKNRAVSNFAGGPEGRTVRSLNVAIDHLNTLDEAVKALNNGNIPAINKLVNLYKQQTGQDVTTNFDSIKQVVSAEIAKAVVGGQTALHDRDDMARRASNAGSPAQLMGINTEFKKLMAGQMKGLRKQYETSTRLKNFDDFLEPGTVAALKAVQGHGDQPASAATAGTKPGGAPGTVSAPSGAVSTRKDRSGKNWYLDANGKVLGAAP